MNPISEAVAGVMLAVATTRLARLHRIAADKQKRRASVKPETLVYDQPTPSHEPVMVDLTRVSDSDFRRRLPTHLKNGRILCQPNRFVEGFEGRSLVL